MTRFISPALALLFFIATIGAYVYVYLDITASAATISTAQSEIAANASKDAFAKSAELFLANTTAERAAAGSYVTAQDDTASAIELVEAAGKSAKVTTSVSSAAINSIAKKRFHEELAVSASATGPFTALARFGTVLELLPRASFIKDVHMEALDKGWHASFTVAFIKAAAPKVVDTTQEPAPTE